MHKSETRGLNDTQRRYLRQKIRSLDAEAGRAAQALWPGVAVIAVLWLLTLAASDVGWLIVTAFWVGIGALILLWVRRDMRKHAATLSQMRMGLESALSHNTAEVFDFRSTGFLSFEEVADEGALYGFEVADQKVVFITGQEFYEGSKFPSLDFSLVYLLDENDRPVDMLIEKRGTKATPAYVIPAKVKLGRDLPDHLEVVDGTLVNVAQTWIAVGDTAT